MISVTGFNNIDRTFDIDMNRPWSFREYMREQPSQKKKVPIDIENGGSKTNRTKILVIPKYVLEAKATYEEFCTLTSSNEDVHEDDIMEDDEMTVNTNIKGNQAQLWAMFNDANFPDLEQISHDHARLLEHQRKAPPAAPRNRSGQDQPNKASSKYMEDSMNTRSNSREKGMEPQQSYKSAVMMTPAKKSKEESSTTSSARRQEFLELRQLIVNLNKTVQETHTALHISRSKTKAHAHQIQ
jgi:hypothetical protein